MVQKRNSSPGSNSFLREEVERGSCRPCENTLVEGRSELKLKRLLRALPGRPGPTDTN